MILPDAPNSASSPAEERPAILTETDSPIASFICDATVRFQTSSYSRSSSPDSPACVGVRNVSPAGLIASCASCALFTLLEYVRGASGTYSAPYSSRACARAAASAVCDNVTESVRI